MAGGRRRGLKAGRTAPQGHVACAVAQARAQRAQSSARALLSLKRFIVFEQGAPRIHFVIGLQIP